MPETITSLTGFEQKPGSNPQGSYVLHIFTDREGKKYKTFDDGVAEKARGLIGTEVVLDFDVRSQNRNGRVFTDNFINDITDASLISRNGSGGSEMVGTGNATANRILAFKAALDLLGAVPESFGELTPSNTFVSIASVADAIYNWAEAERDMEPEPEPEPMVTN